MGPYTYLEDSYRRTIQRVRSKKPRQQSGTILLTKTTLCPADNKVHSKTRPLIQDSRDLVPNMDTPPDKSTRGPVRLASGGSSTSLEGIRNYFNKVALSVEPKFCLQKDDGSGHWRGFRRSGRDSSLDQRTKGSSIVKRKTVEDADLWKPFKEALTTPPARRIIEFARPDYKMLTNIKLYDGTTNPEDHLNRFASAANSGEWPMRV
nr:hypothetical protein [Tanacetum cinerariifolium]